MRDQIIKKQFLGASSYFHTDAIKPQTKPDAPPSIHAMQHFSEDSYPEENYSK